MLRRFTAALLAALLVLPVTASAAASGVYSDVPPDDWSVPAIEKAAEYGLMEGVGGGLFGYGNTMNRASFVKVLCNMFSWAEAKDASPSYTDTSSHWASGWVEAALQNGALASGGAFRPDEAITREEMAVMLVRALDYDQLAASLSDAPLPFPDVKTNRGYIALAYRFGIINGIKQADGSYLFQPNGPSNREVAAAMLVRTYERYTAKIDWLHGFYAFSSYPQIELSAEMDAVSVGWARLDGGADVAPFINQTTQNGNEWVVPSGAEAATDYFTQNQIPYNLNVFAGGDALAAALTDDDASLSTSTSMSHAVYEIVRAAEPYAGVTIDFEGLKAPRKDAFTAFMTRLREQLPAEKTLYVCVQPPEWKVGYAGNDGYDFKALGELCDKVILMAHDYKDRAVPTVGSTRTDNPVSPFPEICNALTAITDPVTGVQDKSKIALAVAIDSVGYQVDENGVITDAALYSPGAETLAGRLKQPEAVRGWSDVYRNSYVTYTGDDGKTYRVWYEDARSVTEKLKLAAMFGVNGVSLWRLGNLPTDDAPGLDYDVWGAVLSRR